MIASSSLPSTRVAFALLNFPGVMLLTCARQDTMPTDARTWMNLACVLYAAHPSAQTS